MHIANDAIDNANNAAKEGDFTYDTPKVDADGKPVVDADGKPVMEQATGTVGAQEAVDNAEAAAGNADKVAKDAELKLQDFTDGSATGTPTDPVVNVKEYNEDMVGGDQKNVDDLTQKVDDTLLGTGTDGISNATIEINKKVDELKDLKDDAVSGLGEVLAAEGQERKDKAKEVAEIAEDAKGKYKEAEKVYKEVNQEYNSTVLEYNKYAIIYGEALYGQTSVDYLDADGNIDEAKLKEVVSKLIDLSAYKKQADKDAAIAAAVKDIVDEKKSNDKYKEDLQTSYNEIQNLDVPAVAGEKSVIEQAKADVEQAQKDYDIAAEAYDQSKKMAEDAIKAADEATKLANTESGNATTAADDTLNYHVNNAQADVDAAKAQLAEKEEALKQAEAVKAEKEAAYRAVQDAKAQEATNKYVELETKKNTAQQALIEYGKNLSGWDKWRDSPYQDLKAAYNVAEGDFKEYVTRYEGKFGLNKKQLTQDQIAAEARQNATNTEEYKALTTAQTTANDIAKQKDAVAAEKDAKDQVLTEKQNAAKLIQDNYLTKIENAEATAKEQLVNGIKTELQNDIVNSSNEINQAEFDKVLNNWANDFVQRLGDNFINLINQGDTELIETYQDSKKLREYLDTTYGVGAWDSFWNKPEFSQWAIRSEKVNTLIDDQIQVYLKDVAEAEEKKVILEAKLAAISAEDSANKASASIPTPYEEIVDLVSDDKIKEADQTVQVAEKTLEDVKAKATDIYKLNTIDLTKFLEKISDAETALAKAKDALNQAKALKDKTVTMATYANNYAGYVDGNAQKGTAYARVETEVINGKEVKKVDANGNPVYLMENKDFDLSNPKVISRPVSKFTNVTKLLGLEVPEQVYKEYLKAIVAEEKKPGDGILDQAGRGISSEDTLPLIYWEVNEKGQLTGKSYTTTTQMVTGRYFMGYAFKKEGDMSTAGYHLDGVMFNYVAPAPATTPTPSPSTNPSTPPTTPGTPPATPPTTPATPPTTPATPVVTTTIPDAPVALAAAPAPAADAAVLGATRTLDAGTDAAVLGARRGTDQAVLGKRRRPETGDSATMMIWLMTLGLSAAAAAVAATQIVKGKKKSEE